jgi:hypothetical protein
VRKRQAAILGMTGVGLGFLAFSALPLVMRRKPAPVDLSVDEWTGNCAVVEARGVYHNVIKLFTNSTWTHTYIFLNQEYMLDPTWPHITVIRRQELPAEYKVGVITPDLTLDERQRLAPELYKLIGARYGLEAIWWFAFSRTLGWRMPGTGHVGNVCSTGLTRAYTRAGLYARLHLLQRPETVSPADLAAAWGFPNPVHTRRKSLREWMDRANQERIARVIRHAQRPEEERRHAQRLDSSTASAQN